MSAKLSIYSSENLDLNENLSEGKKAQIRNRVISAKRLDHMYNSGKAQIRIKRKRNIKS